jgi:hypothetical protein
VATPINAVTSSRNATAGTTDFEQRFIDGALEVDISSCLVSREGEALV